MDYGERMPAPSADDQISWSPLGSGRDSYLYYVMMRRCSSDPYNSTY